MPKHHIYLLLKKTKPIALPPECNFVHKIANGRDKLDGQGNVAKVFSDDDGGKLECGMGMRMGEHFTLT